MFFGTFRVVYFSFGLCQVERARWFQEAAVGDFSAWTQNQGQKIKSNSTRGTKSAEIFDSLKKHPIYTMSTRAKYFLELIAICLRDI